MITPSIAFDARMYDHPGIGRYIRELLKALLSVDRNYHLVLLGSQGLKAALGVGHKNVEFRLLDAPIYSFREQWSVNQAANDCDALHVPHFNIPVFWNKKLIVTIHDLIYFHDASASHLGLGRTYSRFMLNQIKKKASAVITVSKYSRQDLLNSFPGLEPGRVKVVYEAASEVFSRAVGPEELGDFKKKIGIKAPFILFVGSLKRHKNVATLLRAFLKLREKKKISHELVLAGRSDPRNAEVTDLIKNTTGVKYLGEVSDEELSHLYHLCDLFVLPSFAEGFGLPVLEAMSCGAPVIASNRSSLPEILGDAGSLFDPSRIDALSDLIVNVLENNELRKKMSRAGLERSRIFSWQKAAEETLEIYRQVLE